MPPKSEQLSDIEVEAEVFRVIRAHSDKGAKTVYNLIKEHLGDSATGEQIQNALSNLSERAYFS